MRAFLTLLIISSYTSAQLIAPFIYVSEPLSYDDSESYCQANYGTDLATIITNEDRWSAIEIVNGDTNTIWTGLRNTHKTGWWEFIEAEIECPSLFTGACVEFWRNGEPRCHKDGHGEDGFECTVFYANQDYIDNNINCNAKRPFLCNQQYEYTFGSELPAPGDIYEIDDESVSGYIKIGDDVAYFHQSHTLQCIIEYDEEDNVAQHSFVEITIQMYESANVDIDSILLVTAPLFYLLPSNCTRVPALKVIDVHVFTNSVILYVKQAALFEYITEMDIDGSNFTLQGNGEQEVLQIANPEEEFAANNISNGSLTVGIEFYEIVDVYLTTTASLPTAISYPATCDSISACDHNPRQLKFGISFAINLDLGLSVGFSSIGLTVASTSWDIWDRTWPLADVCTDLELPALISLCCVDGTTSTSTTTTTTTTTSPSCDEIWDYDTMGQASLVDNGGCPNGPCHQVIGRVYAKSGKCYKALTGCYGCLPNAYNYPEALQPIVCNPCCDEIWDYDIMGQQSLVNNGGCPNGPCHQVIGRVYKKSGKCYKALTGCYGCLPNAYNYPEALDPIVCNPCNSVSAHAYIGNDIIPVNGYKFDENNNDKNNFSFYLWIVVVAILVNISVCLLLYWFWVRPRNNKFVYNEVKVIDKEIEEMDL